ncbi:fumarylacetoacetate hydrolase family protein [Trinickia terrae]|uniref:Fumarylacetoacetate hydrolase family protein n=1 Tax=Trinickia terrae TaxID=2571161 RepID=A0A4U1IEZ0_9BURK|nr:fumarylacetoacetate hydrolase family protein [Trinickia terrae]TKC92273.1 fumarylacetoacetate hydrolase family protein [Trinickia terrae]
MKICWFDDDRLGWVIGNEVLDVTPALEALPQPRYPHPLGDALVAHLDTVREAIVRLKNLARRHPLAEVRLLSPVARPSKIIGVPVNYTDHVREAQNATATFKQYDGGIEDQGLFLKATSSLVGCSEGVQVHFPHRPTHHEIELAVVIGKPGKNIALTQALSHVAGYAIALDMTVRGNEDRSFRKSIDTYSVLGPCLTTADEVPDPQSLPFSLSVNEQLRQQSNTRHMIMSIAQQIAWASTFYTLLPGDVIMTGTCEGVGPVQTGDVIHATIEGLGSMSVDVR